MTKTKSVEELAHSVDALIEKYGKLSGSASAAAKAKILAHATELRDALEKFSQDLPPAVEKGVGVTLSAAQSAKDVFVSDVVPLALSALSTALDVISDKTAQAKVALENSTTVPAEPAPVVPKKKRSHAWVAWVTLPAIAATAAAVAYAIFAPVDDGWIPADNDPED